MRVVKKILKRICQSRRVILTTHVNPDGDALGSEIAMAHLLTQLKIKWSICNGSPSDVRYDFLSFMPRVCVYRSSKGDLPKADLLIVLDCPELSRTGVISEKDIPRDIICIDHHASNHLFGRWNYVDETASSTAELIYKLIVASRVSLTKKMAEAIYCGIATDTGFFSQENTNSQSFYVASQLVEAGVRPEIMAWEIRGRKSRGYYRIDSRVRNSMELYHHGTVCAIHIRKAWLKKEGAVKIDTNEFFEGIRMMEGVQICILFWEKSSHDVKVSFRARRGHDVCRLAQQFGGGGHRLAAGCTIHASLADAKRSVLEAIS